MRKTAFGILTLGMASWLMMGLPVSAQSVFYQEGFNTDGDGSRYFIGGRGSGVFGDGPAAWDHNFDVDAIGLADKAPARRAAILWSEQPNPFTFTDEALDVFSNLVDWALDGKSNARVAIYPSFVPPTAAEIEFLLLDAGHTTSVLDTTMPLPDPSTLDLVIQTNEAALTPPTLFTNYGVPVITFAAGNHDDILISSIGQPVTLNPGQIQAKPEYEGHPVLGDYTGTIPWTFDPVELQGIGRNVPPSADILATYTDNDVEYPAILLLEKGADLLGVFNPDPEGVGYILGGDLNADFGGGATDLAPRTLRLAPIDVTGLPDLKLTLSLAATDVDFEPPDFMRISVDPQNTGTFVTLGEFLPQNAALTDGTTTLRPDRFLDVTYELPSDSTNLVVLVEAYNTFPNEIMAIDNIRITTSQVIGMFGNFDGDNDVDSNDLGAFIGFWTGDGGTGATFATGDSDGDGDVDSVDLGEFIAAWTGSLDASGVASQPVVVPEPASHLLLWLAVAGALPSVRRRRGR